MSEDKRFVESLFGKPEPDPETERRAGDLNIVLTEHGLTERHASFFEGIPEERWNDRARELANLTGADSAPANIRHARQVMAHAERTGQPNGAELALLAARLPASEEHDRPGFDGGVVQPEPVAPPLDLIYVRDADD